jgi:hypothetical protein
MFDVERTSTNWPHDQPDEDFAPYSGRAMLARRLSAPLVAQIRRPGIASCSSTLDDAHDLL